MGMPFGIAIAGAGLIGKRHLEALRQAQIPIHSVIDPDAKAAEIAAIYDVPHYRTLAEALEESPGGIVLATPNALHKEGALTCIKARVPVLVEKPLADTVEAAEAIVTAGQKANVPVLTGHHRRHVPLISKARELVASGSLGTIVSVHASFWLAKPDSYFATEWRRSPGAGPVLVNLVHDMDLLRFLVGDIASVRAIQTSRVRNNPIEDACAALLTFENGVLGTVQVSDAIVSPWSWEMTAHDNPAYPPTGENSLLIGGTHGSLALPRGELWTDGQKRDWWEPISRTTLVRSKADPLVAQMENFRDVIAGKAAPVCSGEEGLKSIKTVLAVHQAASTGQQVELST